MGKKKQTKKESLEEWRDGARGGSGFEGPLLVFLDMLMPRTNKCICVFV